MADNVFLKVDASEILAKLHLAAKKAAGNDNDCFWVNTGIVDDADNPPEKVGKVRFDLSNPTNEYQAGYVAKVKIKRKFSAQNVLTDLKNLKAKIHSKTADEIAKPLDPKEQKEFDEQKKVVIDSLAKANSSIKPTDADFTDPKKFDELCKKAEEEFKNGNGGGAGEKAEQDEAIIKAKTDAVKRLDTYMRYFAGKDNVKAIDVNRLGEVMISPEAKDQNHKGIIVHYEIQEMPNAEKEKLFAAQKANESLGKEQMFDIKMCFFVKYTLTADK